MKIPNFTCFYFFEVKEDIMIAKLSKGTVNQKIYPIEYSTILVERKRKEGFASISQEKEEETQEHTLEYLVNQSKVRKELLSKQSSSSIHSTITPTIHYNPATITPIINFTPSYTLNATLNEILAAHYTTLNIHNTIPIIDNDIQLDDQSGTFNLKYLL